MLSLWMNNGSIELKAGKEILLVGSFVVLFYGISTVFGPFNAELSHLLKD